MRRYRLVARGAFGIRLYPGFLLWHASQAHTAAPIPREGTTLINNTDATMPGTGMPAGGPQRPRYRRKRYAIPLGIAGGFVVLMVGTAIGAAGKPATTVTTARQSSVPAPTVTVTETATPQASPPQASPQPAVTKTVIKYRTGTPGSGGSAVTSRFNGSGTQNTGTFTVPDNWHLSWSYWGCPDSPANFVVDEDNSDGSSDFNGVSVNELGAGRGPVATYAYGDGGSHYFSITTEGCSWSLAVVTG
jgi:hypothetical protein